MSETNLVEVYRAANVFQAHLIKIALDEAGIHAQVTGEMLQGALGELPLGWSTVPAVLVLEPDAEQARALIEKIEKTAAGDD